MNLPWDFVTIADVCAEIAAGKVSSFSRYGDGEFYWIIGVPNFTNRSGHHTIEAGSEELRQSLLAFSRNYGTGDKLAAMKVRAGGAGGEAELRQTLLDQPEYRLAGPLFFRNYGTPEREAKWKAIEVWIRDHHLEHLRWCSNLLFVKSMVQAARTRTVFPLLAELRKRRVVVVGPHWLAGLGQAGAFKPWRFIEVPEHDCYLAKQPTIDAMMRAYEQNRAEGGPPLFFSLSCAYLANLLVHQLYPVIGHACWLFDVGSVWDPYVGVVQRGYHVDITKQMGGVVL